ncbi:conserved hypothetical protein [Burkholderia gladioli]|uniref:hypothetical protein n=1 Tax=Burkholderia gladioli TaxID=28095 RepID=UPI001CB0802C|nr:hypothetical protein [Burkholderia gladioli]CAG9202353.1 conserved hypothetical protein [Burkholderia gladioli]
MGVREQQANQALRVLDDMHRHGEIDRQGYRQRRRAVLEALGDTSGAGSTAVTASEEVAAIEREPGRDTVRRTVPAQEFDGGGEARLAPAAATNRPRRPRARAANAGRATTWLVVLLGMAFGVAAFYWFMMMS